MGLDPVPFVWLCGPSGVGKSAVGWEIFAGLNDAGTTAAFVDADQLGLCYPTPAEAPENHHVKACNLAAVWPGFRAAGAQVLIVSGIVNTLETVHTYAEPLAGTVLTVCRLRADRDELRGRFLHRGWRADHVEETLTDADALDATDFADLCVDTDDRSIVEVAEQVVTRTVGRPRDWSEPARASPAASAPSAKPGPEPEPAPAPVCRSAEPRGGGVPVLWLCGPPAVGTSTVGFEIFSRLLRSGLTTAYVDLAQIRFCRPVPADDPAHHQLVAGNLAAIWPTFRAAGARCLVIAGPVNDVNTVRTYADAVPEATLTLCRLHAGRDALAHRVRQRGRGGGPPIPGDELDGLPTAALDEAAARAAERADVLERDGIGELRVDTDGRTVAEVADLVQATAGGWPDRTNEQSRPASQRPASARREG